MASHSNGLKPRSGKHFPLLVLVILFYHSSGKQPKTSKVREMERRQNKRGLNSDSWFKIPGFIGGGKMEQEREQMQERLEVRSLIEEG